MLELRQVKDLFIASLFYPTKALEQKNLKPDDTARCEHQGLCVQAKILWWLKDPVPEGVAEETLEDAR